MLYVQGGISRDITNRVQAEMALRESERRSRKISELANDITHSCLADENGAFCIDWLSGKYGTVNRVYRRGNQRSVMLEIHGGGRGYPCL